MTTQLWGISSSIWKPETQLRYLHFLPYLESPSTSLWSSQLVRFWLDVESFRCSASMVITSSWAPPRVSRERLDRCKVLVKLLSFRNHLHRESQPILLGWELPKH